MVPVEIDNTQLILVRGSVADQEVDAIVDAANTSMRGGGGIDGVIHRLAGPGLLRELTVVAPHGSVTTEVVVTHGHNLPQPFVFHVAGPRWLGGNHAEAKELAGCYRNCLIEADQRTLTSIAFCSISTGVYRYPIEMAAQIAVQTTADYLRGNLGTILLRIVFAMYGAGEYDCFELALRNLS
jgi:O-acetyl-ADP-ribose deacetylase (regulator of RNase III)